MTTTLKTGVPNIEKGGAPSVIEIYKIMAEENKFYDKAPNMFENLGHAYERWARLRGHKGINTRLTRSLLSDD